jgi:hypothetical protein
MAADARLRVGLVDGAGGGTLRPVVGLATGGLGADAAVAPFGVNEVFIATDEIRPVEAAGAGRSAGAGGGARGTGLGSGISSLR